MAIYLVPNGSDGDELALGRDELAFGRDEWAFGRDELTFGRDKSRYLRDISTLVGFGGGFFEMGRWLGRDGRPVGSR